MSKVTEMELLKLQNIHLRIELLTKEREALNRELAAKYGAPGESIRITGDGTIIRSIEPKEAAGP